MAHELGNYVGTRLGYGLRLASKHVLHRSSLGSRAGRLSVSGCPGSHDNDIREGSSGGGLWSGSRRVAGVRTHRKGCQGGELRLVSRQFL